MPIRTLIAAAAIATTPLLAMAAPWSLDKSHTHISFEVNHLGFSTTFGTFSDYDATIDFDPENIEASSVEFSINAASINTFFAKRDDHIRGADFLKVDEHATITFVSTGIEKTGDDTAKVTGDLTLLGVTQPVTFDAKLNNIGPNPFAPDITVAGFDLTGEVDRTQFGMGFGAPAIGAVIPVAISLEINQAK